jgi:hypothetical protein
MVTIQAAHDAGSIRGYLWLPGQGLRMIRGLFCFYWGDTNHVKCAD